MPVGNSVPWYLGTNSQGPKSLVHRPDLPCDLHVVAGVHDERPDSSLRRRDIGVAGTTRGEFGDGLPELVARKMVAVARHAHQPVLGIRVELDRHPDPAVARPVAAKASVDLNGTQVHAGATAGTAREAVDRMVDRLIRQLNDRPRGPRRRRR
jgi:hypothetical protein